MNRVLNQVFNNNHAKMRMVIRRHGQFRRAQMTQISLRGLPINYTNLRISEIPKKSSMQVFNGT